MSKKENKDIIIDSWGCDHSQLPVHTVTDYHKDEDIYMIDYQTVRHIKVISDDDTDFIETVTVEECSRVNRQDYLNEQSGDVGILNIIKKMALSGDTSLLNQTHRISIPGVEKDALGRAVEDVVDLSRYSNIDKIDALESYKKGAEVFASLDEELKGKKSMEEVAKLSDTEINDYLKSKIDAITAEVAKLRAANDAAKEGN